MRIGIVNDLAGVAALLQQSGRERSGQSRRLDRARRRRGRGSLRAGHAGSDPDGRDDAGHGRRGNHPPHHGQHALRDPDRDRQRADHRQTESSRRWDTARSTPSTPLCTAAERSRSGPRRSWRRSRPSRASSATSAAAGVARQPVDSTLPPRRHDRLVAIGASAGGPAALATLLQRPPQGFPRGDRHRAARRRTVRRRHGHLAERQYGAPRARRASKETVRLSARFCSQRPAII